MNEEQIISWIIHCLLTDSQLDVKMPNMNGKTLRDLSFEYNRHPKE